MAEKIEAQIEEWLDTQDNEQNKKFSEPCFVATSVATNIIEKIHKARVMQELIEIPAPPGHGKSSAGVQYQLQCRKSEGFDAPVWIITLLMKPINIITFSSRFNSRII